MIRITPEMAEDWKRDRRFIAGEDDDLNHARRDRWVMIVDEDGDTSIVGWSDGEKDTSNSRGGSFETQRGAIVDFFECIDAKAYNSELYSFQSEDEMVAWLNRPYQQSL